MDTNSFEALNRVLAGMIQSHPGVSDLLFIAGKPPQVEAHGKLQPVDLDSAGPLNNARIETLARTIINGNERLIKDLADTGSCDCSYALPDVCRFRVNIYRQNGNHAMVLRRLQSEIPSLEKLKMMQLAKLLTK